jgi:arabinogalactan endo-1,4-beta-galactosidase
MEFMIGADVSSLQAMEDCGAEYFDFDGTKKDALELLKAHGVNYIRLRLWNHPTTSFDRGDYCNLENTLGMAKRVKSMGMKLLLDFHYSDSWADWKSQHIPAEWTGMDSGEIAEKVYEYTKVALERLREVGAYPDMVQIGNEIGRGLLWDYGTLEHPETIVKFLNRGMDAVRDTETEQGSAKIMLHIENGGDTEQTERFFSTLLAHGLQEFDVIGLSYYPYWGGPYEKLQRNMRNIAKCFQKPVAVAETAFPYTDESTDEIANVVGEELTLKELGLKATPQNQRAVIEEIIRMVYREPNGCGVFYWEPGWYNKPGVGVMKGMGNEWENQAVFDKNGNAVEGLHAFEVLTERG